MCVCVCVHVCAGTKAYRHDEDCILEPHIAGFKLLTTCTCTLHSSSSPTLQGRHPAVMHTLYLLVQERQVQYPTASQLSHTVVHGLSICLQHIWLCPAYATVRLAQLGEDSNAPKFPSMIASVDNQAQLGGRGPILVLKQAICGCGMWWSSHTAH